MPPVPKIPRREERGACVGSADLRAPREEGDAEDLVGVHPRGVVEHRHRGAEGRGVPPGSRAQPASSASLRRPCAGDSGVGFALGVGSGR